MLQLISAQEIGVKRSMRNGKRRPVCSENLKASFAHKISRWREASTYSTCFRRVNYLTGFQRP